MDYFNGLGFVTGDNELARGIAARTPADLAAMADLTNTNNQGKILLLAAVGALVLLPGSAKLLALPLAYIGVQDYMRMY